MSIHHTEQAIFQTQDGSSSVMSQEFGVPYHSKYGAIQETQHVFIDAGLLERGLYTSKLRVLEFGFGTGLNTLMTYLAAKSRSMAVEYTTVEAYPLVIDQIQKLNYIEQLQVPDARVFFEEIHQCAWGKLHQLNEYFSFTKHQSLFEEIALPGHSFDVVYFDAFAPSAQPHLWEKPILQKVFDAMADQAIFTTYCAKGVVKRNLKDIGLLVEALPGPPGKREMTRAKKIIQ